MPYSQQIERNIMFTKFPVIETERLILREINTVDTEAVFAIRGDYEVTKYNSGAAYTELDQAENLIKGIQEEYQLKSALRWGITLKAEDCVIGMVGFNYWNRTDNRGSVGFDLARAYWRRGIMREALRSTLNFGFINMGLHRIEADASIYNEASIGLLKSIGFQQEGIQREQYYEDDTYHDLVLLAILENDWKTII